jgi:hypothetical protein
MNDGSIGGIPPVPIITRRVIAIWKICEFVGREFVNRHC